MKKVILFLSLGFFVILMGEIQTTYIDYHKIDKAWKHSKGNGTVVAVLDWCFDMGPESAKKYIHPVSLVPDKPIGKSDPWHGEWMAKIIHTIAPEAKIIPIRCQPGSDEKNKDTGEKPFQKYLVQGIRYAADHGATAVTNSMGPVKLTPDLLTAVDYALSKGTIFINVHPEYLKKENKKYTWGSKDQIPDTIIHAGIISVPKYPCEPQSARDIFTWPYSINPVFRDGWGYSNSPPIIAGVIALMKSVNPKLTPKEIKKILKETGTMKDGFLVLDAEKAVLKAKN